MKYANPHTCPNHWRGKHRWVAPGTNMTVGDGPFGATAGAMTMSVCSRCGVSYAVAVTAAKNHSQPAVPDDRKGPS